MTSMMHSGLLGVLGAIALSLYAYPWVGLFYIPILIYNVSILYDHNTASSNVTSPESFIVSCLGILQKDNKGDQASCSSTAKQCVHQLW